MTAVLDSRLSARAYVACPCAPCECGSKRGSFWHDGDTWTCGRCGADWKLPPIMCHTPAGPLRQGDRFFLARAKPRARKGSLLARSIGGDLKSVNATADNGAARTIAPSLINRIVLDARPRERVTP
jgi:hypothetical protein